MQLSAFGFDVTLPPGWEGRIDRRDTALRTGPAAMPQFHPEERTYPIARFANFALPVDVEDYGSGAVELMGPDNLYVTLLEFGPESLGQPLFSAEGMPRRLRPGQFSPNQLQRTISGQGGFQTFFTEARRPMCLFIALGSYANRVALVEQANLLLDALTIGPR